MHVENFDFDKIIEVNIHSLGLVVRNLNGALLQYVSPDGSSLHDTYPTEYLQQHLFQNHDLPYVFGSRYAPDANAPMSADP